VSELNRKDGPFDHVFLAVSPADGLTRQKVDPLR
jgi:hypothetical protein